MVKIGSLLLVTTTALACGATPNAPPPDTPPAPSATAVVDQRPSADLPRPGPTTTPAPTASATSSASNTADDNPTPYCSFGLGYLSGLAGIGGGIFYVPVFAYLLNFPLHIATATSQFGLAILGLTGTVSHIVSGAFVHGVHRTIVLAIGVVVRAQTGARLSRVIQGRLIIRILAVTLGLVGVRVLYTAFA